LGFEGWQVNPNLIFGDGETRLRPQMEVWFCAIAGTYAARHNALIGTGLDRVEAEGGKDDMQHRRLRLRSASQGSAPAPAAQHHSTATKETQEHLTRVQTGNSVSPLDKLIMEVPGRFWKATG
jgi:hypothetical protein